MKNKGIIGLFMILFLLAFVSQPASAQVALGGETTKPQTKVSIVSGQIFDEEGEPLPGVSIRNLKTKEACITDVDGKFRMSAAGPVRVAISYIGKKPQEMTLTPGKSLKIVLEDDESKLNEVVVTGIYSRNKESFTGSSQTFDSSELKGVGNQNLIQSLKTLDPAFTVLENNMFGSDPNKLPDLEIRGKSSIVGLKEQFGEYPNQPLFIIDGFETTLQTIMDLSMDRIQSVTLL
ncbi:MAG: carboxypeptidase-like regulatory domain-containing protein, partial [Duncaniella sp.]|nr:carboxypeptidase-like regulatory domain-containing protein [Duncaniella sp.]